LLLQLGQPLRNDAFLKFRRNGQPVDGSNRSGSLPGIDQADGDDFQARSALLGETPVDFLRGNGFGEFDFDNLVQTGDTQC
jgi:hypothetical protein